MKTCPKCGQSNVQGATYCSRCAALLEPRVGSENTRFGNGSQDDPDATIGPGDGRPGSTAGQFEILTEVGRGGMGVVYHARDRLLGREVALKRLSPRLLGSQVGIQRFLAEARAIAALSHPHIVQIHQFGEDAEGPFIAMEWIEGQDLRSLLKQRGKLTLQDALGLIRPVLAALDYAHRKGVVHRDLKPANILLTHEGIPKVVDFGLARVLTTEDLTLTGESVGTLAYMAPEQFGDAKHADHRSDIFALAKVIYQMLTGEYPGTVDPQLLPDEVREVLLRALRSKPEERYFSVREFREALEGIATRAVGREPTPRPRTRYVPRRRWGWVVGVPLVVVIGIVLGVVYLPSLWQGSSDDQQAPARRTSSLSPSEGTDRGESTPADIVSPADSEDLPRAVPEMDVARRGALSAGESRAFTVYSGVQMDFVWIPVGRFRMGSPGSEPGHEDNESPVHEVEITQGFWLGKYEVTQAQWRAVTGSNPSDFKGDTGRPVEGVSWNDCQEFIGKLNEEAGREVFRLPTEAEWEYACRAGTTTPFHTGRCLSTEDANYDGNHPQEGCSKGEKRETTISVGSLAANAWGLYDMHGNVYEWCHDWYGSDYYGSSPGQDPEGPGTGSYRVLRGGSWVSYAHSCCSANRGSLGPGLRYHSSGLRLTRTAG
ncbi:MAG: SUMF1/EgtB/PvdO family nonheme iron enzyme [Candidatus Eisenbacteria sp.]|nr:SUMF1/EgtB/PvdO family nonheme iron enzyme [Candidatus Eisenbacteria bacterium]